LTAALRRPAYEVIPLDGVEEAVAGLPRGVRLTVTASPSRGVERTIDVAVTLAGLGYRVTPHLSARLVADHNHLAELTERLTGAGLRDVFVVGGDAREPVGKFDGALDLLVALDQLGMPFDEVGIAGYPEAHPLIADDVIVQAMWDKRVYASYIVSQMCFDPDAVRAWVRRVRRRGVRLPIEIGVPGSAALPRLLRVSAKIGVGESARFLRGHRGLLRSFAGPRTFRPERLLAGLGSLLADPVADVRGLHFYTFNEVARTQEWRRGMLAGVAAA
ncbi:MAG: methylenetetrahydrofolate reductase, partial [Streptosporangiaceae bacterium]